jgi:peptidoglycan hydrolase-like protein with peptidoglycan-binding domain
MTGTRRPRRRRAARTAVAASVVLAAGAAAAAASGFGLSSHDDNTPRSELPAATAKVTRQTLIDTQTETGDLGYPDSSELASRAGGTVTALAAANAVVKRGQVLYRLDIKPVVLFYGTLPAYRALSSGTEGADVKQFERNLYALGYRGFTVDETYSAATVTAVKKWQKHLGLDQTGTVELGRIVYAAGQVRVDTQKSATGDAVQPGAAILTYTGTSPVIVAKLDVSDKRLTTNSASVEVTLPDGTQVAGKIAAAKTVIVTGDNGDTETKIQVTVTVDDEKALAGLDQASVKVAFTASKRANVLTVPVAALLALAEGGYGVQVVDGTTTRIVTVQTGLFASGRVEVSGDGLAEGMTVGVPA